MPIRPFTAVRDGADISRLSDAIMLETIKTVLKSAPDNDELLEAVAVVTQQLLKKETPAGGESPEVPEVLRAAIVDASAFWAQKFALTDQKPDESDNDDNHDAGEPLSKAADECSLAEPESCLEYDADKTCEYFLTRMDVTKDPIPTVPRCPAPRGTYWEDMESVTRQMRSKKFWELPPPVEQDFFAETTSSPPSSPETLPSVDFITAPPSPTSTLATSVCSEATNPADKDKFQQMEITPSNDSEASDIKKAQMIGEYEAQEMDTSDDTPHGKASEAYVAHTPAISSELLDVPMGEDVQESDMAREDEVMQDNTTEGTTCNIAPYVSREHDPSATAEVTDVKMGGDLEGLMAGAFNNLGEEKSRSAVDDVVMRHATPDQEDTEMNDNTIVQVNLHKTLIDNVSATVTNASHQLNTPRAAASVPLTTLAVPVKTPITTATVPSTAQAAFEKDDMTTGRVPSTNQAVPTSTVITTTTVPSTPKVAFANGPLAAGTVPSDSQPKAQNPSPSSSKRARENDTQDGKDSSRGLPAPKRQKKLRVRGTFFPVQEAPMETLQQRTRPIFQSEYEHDVWYADEELRKFLPQLRTFNPDSYFDVPGDEREGLIRVMIQCFAKNEPKDLRAQLIEAINTFKKGLPVHLQNLIYWTRYHQKKVGVLPKKGDHQFHVDMRQRQVVVVKIFDNMANTNLQALARELKRAMTMDEMVEEAIEAEHRLFDSTALGSGSREYKFKTQGAINAWLKKERIEKYLDLKYGKEAEIPRSEIAHSGLKRKAALVDDFTQSKKTYYGVGKNGVKDSGNDNAVPMFVEGWQHHLEMCRREFRPVQPPPQQPQAPKPAKKKQSALEAIIAGITTGQLVY
ncbi:hypothetical protein CC80DRAFT_503707 [Byssothecium circinans]|uniref:Uncharacterized protein n=1 Tax=Byssothecium circinans TaxID=147558 RepID=A0A6A5U8A4_9PLEO|nr:hypothetical protein CC80DRAFT_503707 [Byssothecium circinans]